RASDQRSFFRPDDARRGWQVLPVFHRGACRTAYQDGRAMRVPRLDREQAVAVAALALLLLICVCTSGLLLRMRFDAARESAERHDLLARLETRVRADAGRSIAAAPPSAFLDAPTQGLASAALQAYLAQLADLQHAGLISSGGEAAKRDEAPDTI